MNTKLFKLITAGALAVLLSSCGDTVVDNYDNSPVRSKATINVRVIDASGGAEAPLAAKVTLNTTKEVKTSDATGNVSFKNIPVGYHSVLVEKEGYATALYSAPIVPTEENMNISIAQDITVPANLYPTSAKLSGLVVEDNDNGTQAPLAGATVRVELSTGTGIVTRIFTKVTDATGSFAFDSLPAVGKQYSLFISDAAGKYRVITADAKILQAGLPQNAGVIRYNSTLLNSFFELTAYPSVIKNTDNITFTFSNSIDFTRFTLDDIVKIYKDGDLYTPPSGKLTRIVATTDLPSQLVVGLVGANVNEVPLWPSKFTICFNDLKAIDGKVTGINYCTRDIYTSASDNAIAFRVESYNDRIDSTANVVLEFSQNIDAAAFQPGWITINSSTTLAEAIVAGKTITLVPVGGKWHSDLSIVVSSSLKATSGETLSGGFSKTIKLKTAVLKGVAVGAPLLDSINWKDDILDYDASGVLLKFARIPGATDYYIYGKANTGRKKDEYVYLGSIPDVDKLYKNDSILQASITLDRTKLGLDYSDDAQYGVGTLQGTNTVQLIIQARNSESQTNLADATPLLLKDTWKPSYSSTLDNGQIIYYASGNPFNYSYGSSFSQLLSSTVASTAAQEINQCVALSEPMDTTIPLVGNWQVSGSAPETDAAKAAAKIVITPTWGNKAIFDKVDITVQPKDYDRYVCFNIKTTDTPNAEYASGADLNVRYVINGLKDKAGNDLYVEKGTAPTLTTTGGLQIRLVSTAN